MQIDDICREHFYCPGPFNEDIFAREYARFLILRKQCSRYLTTGQLNVRLALNNAITLLNSFGATTFNHVVSQYPEEVRNIIAPFMVTLNIFDREVLINVMPDEKVTEMLARIKKSEMFGKQ